MATDRDIKASTPRTKLVAPGCLVSAADPERVEQGRAWLLGDEAYVDLAETFRALADTSRVKIVYSLLRQELCTCDLAVLTGISESAVSQHLRVLRQLRLVKSRRNGKMVFHTLDDDHIRTLLAVCLSHIRDAGDQPEAIDRVLESLAADAALTPGGGAVYPQVN